MLRSVTVVWMGWWRPMGRGAKWATSSHRSYTCPLSAFEGGAGGAVCVSGGLNWVSVSHDKKLKYIN